MDTDYEFDLAVIGSGGAGMAAGIAASQAGKRVVLLEQGTLGGTCVNIGCVPSKTLLAAAGTRHVALSNPFPGAPTSAGPADLGALSGQKGELVERLRGSKYADVAAAYGFGVRSGQASFAGPETLIVDGEPLSASVVVIATGAEPAVPAIPGLGTVDYLTSTTAMELRELPESMIVVGAGYVGLEMAQLFAHLGCTVAIVGRIAPHSEPEMAAVLRSVLAEDGVTVMEEHAGSVAQAGRQVGVTTSSGQFVTADRLLIAVGRTARTDGLNLESAGITKDAAGFIIVDDHQRTANPRVYAAGDVTGGAQYVYVAAAEGKVAAHNALRDDLSVHQARVDYAGLPAVIFTRPQMASAGLTEVQALDAGYRCDSRVLDFREVPRALANRDTRGAIKMVSDAASGRVLGISAAGEGVGEVMLAATYAIRAGMTTRQIADTWAPYLTIAESVRLVAGLFHNHMPTSCCA